MVDEIFQPKFEKPLNPATKKSDKEVILKEKSDQEARLLNEETKNRLNLKSEIGTQVDPQNLDVQQKFIEAEMKVKDLKMLNVEELIELEKGREGILLYAFTKWGDQHVNDKDPIANFKPYKKPQQGDRLEINFRGNAQAEFKIGANDLLPPEVRRITVISANGEKRTSLRRVGLKSGKKEAGFYDDEGYIPIFTGDTVIVGGEEQTKEVGIDLTFREKYFDEKGQRWNEDAYEKVEGEGDRQFFEKYFQTSDAELISSTIKLKSNLKPAQSKDIREVLKTPERHNWLTTVTDAETHFRRKTGISIRPSVIFAFIRHESNFMPGVPNRGSRQEKQSTALGLGQFIEGTWLKFVRENRDIVRKINGRVPFSPEGKLALRTNPELSIYAMTWYVADLAKGLGFREVTPQNADEIYLRYHQGEGGAHTVKSYFKQRRLGKSIQEAARSVRLFKHQQEKADRGELESYFQWIQNTSATVASTAEKYDEQLSA